MNKPAVCLELHDRPLIAGEPARIATIRRPAGLGGPVEIGFCEWPSLLLQETDLVAVADEDCEAENVPENAQDAPGMAGGGGVGQDKGETVADDWGGY